MNSFSFAASREPLILKSVEDTRRLGRSLARALARVNPGALLLYGALGAGKTTFCRALVEALPGGAQAEVASPSFTICNIYSTNPDVHHFDLYRMQPGLRDEALLDSFESEKILTIVEWPEHLHENDMPPDGLALLLEQGQSAGERRATFAALGPLGENFIDCIGGLSLEHFTLEIVV